MVPPARCRARGTHKGKREDASPARRAAGRPRGVVAPRRSERPCALRPAEPHIPRAHSALPRPRRPLRGSAAAARLPQRAVGKAGTGRGTRGRARVRRRRRRLRHCPVAPASASAGCASAGGGREGGRWRRRRGDRPSGQWAGPLGPHTLSTATRGASATRAGPAPPATRGRWRRGTVANRSLRLGARRRRAARAAGSDGSGSCHVEGAGGVIVGVEDEGEAQGRGSGVLVGRVEARPVEPWL